mmetsp:Transcript_30671/g.45405  ORF Transcript_30671/g.45405 Transcript_30671/m.45405 type:complete len:259 (-) Transcript_30671:217-993(-)|eukprot:CAMPEP_0195514352 /NCGR_PEP_ID=MMETSP0794_2-20130614/5769_1 /TAXON_ID=515487 /ORGANISM="Stephanopyxis turris, Strain CCMP 815" /LENGTH=258 /DNA_ID=CAMNT_0040642581 /DNA_START=94 /DNA_END=870 /DNA_ORIENTATION=-
MSCCPPTAYPHLESSYVPKGENLDLVGEKIYQIKSSTADANTNLVVYVAHDIFGFDAGRTKQVCDAFSDSLKCDVVLVDGFKGTQADVTIPDSVPAALKSGTWDITGERYLKVIDELEKDKNRKIAIIGFCWGGYACWKLCDKTLQNPWVQNVCCGVTYHPAQKLANMMYGEDEYAMAKTLCAPQAIYSAGDDGPQYFPDGAHDKSGDLPSGGEMKLFENMRHGWMTRADITTADEGVLAAIEEGMNLGVAFVNKNAA